MRSSMALCICSNNSSQGPKDDVSRGRKILAMLHDAHRHEPHLRGAIRGPRVRPFALGRAVQVLGPPWVPVIWELRMEVLQVGKMKRPTFDGGERTAIPAGATTSRHHISEAHMQK